MTFGWMMLAVAVLAQDPPRTVWEQQYKERSAVAMAAQIESASRPVFRYRVAIAGLLQLKPGMTAAEIGAGSGYLARVMADQVGAAGRVIATELEPKMVAYINERAKADKVANLTAIQGTPVDSGLEPGSVDAIAVVNTFSFFEKPADLSRSIAAALKPGGLLLVVDFPREGEGSTAVGIDAHDVVKIVTAAGLARQDEISLVTGEYAIRFRKR